MIKEQKKAAVLSLGFWGGLLGTIIASADATCQIIDGLPLEVFGVPGSIISAIAAGCALIGRLKANKQIGGLLK